MDSADLVAAGADACYSSCVAAPEDSPLLRSSAAFRNPNFACSNRSARAVVSSVVRFLTTQGTFGPGYESF